MKALLPAGRVEELLDAASLESVVYLMPLLLIETLYFVPKN
jgi:hypothetical protein